MADQSPCALVTGGAVRIGKALALGLAHAGYDIALHYNTSADAAEATAADIRATGVACTLFQQDLRNAAALGEMMQHVADACPGLSVLVNNASSYSSAGIAATDVSTFDLHFDVNLRAPFFLTQAFAQICKNGNVINILDNKIGFNQYQYAAYLLAKKTLAEFTRLAALEYAPNIRVNGIAPGVVLPAETRSSAYIDWRVQGIPLHKQGSTNHLVQAVRFILENDFLTGQILVVDGGENISNVGQNTETFQGKSNNSA